MPIQITLHLDKKLKRRIKNLHNNHLGITHSPVLQLTDTFSIAELEQEFQALCFLSGDRIAAKWATDDINREKLKQKLKKNRAWLTSHEPAAAAIEEYKTAIIRALHEHLQLTYCPSKEKPEPSGPSWWRRLAFVGVIILDYLQYIAMNTLYAHEAVCFIPGLSIPVATVLGIGLTIIEVVISYAFDAPQLKERLGIKSDEPASGPKLRKEQALLTAETNKLLFDVTTFNKIPSKHYQQYAQIDKCFNRYLKDMKNHPPAYSEGWGTKAIRLGFTALNMAQIFGMALFGAKAFIASLSLTLLTIPVAVVALTALLVVAQMVPRYIYMARDFFRFLNPTAKQHEDLGVTLSEIDIKKPSEFEENIVQKKQYEQQSHIMSRLRVIRSRNAGDQPVAPTPIRNINHRFLVRPALHNEEKSDIIYPSKKGVRSR